MLDEKTALKLDEAYGEKLMISLSRFAKLTGLTRNTLEEYIAVGTLRAISSKKHVHITRAMAVEFLTQGGGIERSAPPPPPLSPLKRAAMQYAEKHRKRPRRNKASG